MKKKIFSIILSLAVVFTFSFSMPVYAGKAKLKTIKIYSGRKYTEYDIKDGVKMTWKGVKGAQKYYVVKNGKRIKMVKATKKNKKYVFKEKDPIYDSDTYSVCATKKVKQKQYYNKKTKKWQAKKPAKKYIKNTRYKKVNKVFATSATLPIKLNSGSNGEETGAATNIQYYTDADGNIVGYKGFNIAGVDYFDIADNKNVIVDKSYWKEFISTAYMPNGKSLLKEWATVGDSICRQYKDYKTYWGSWRNDYTGKDNRLDYINGMSRIKEQTKGGKSRDNSKVTGLLTAGSFKEVREKMAKMVKERIDHDALDGEYSKILGNSKLTVLDDNTPQDIIYTVGTNIDENSWNTYKYSSHAMIFYDFKLEPITDDNLIRITELDKYKSMEEADKALDSVTYSNNDSPVYADNEGISTVQMSRTSGTSYTNTLSTTMSNSEQISYGQSFQINNELTFAKDVFKQEYNIGFTWGQAYTSAMENGESKSETNSTEHTVTVDVPAQSSLEIREQKSDLNCRYGFKTPMKVSYKVCFADIVGKVYADDMELCDFESYDQGAYATFFGKGGNNGSDAIDSLDKRAIVNKDKETYDDFYGEVYTYRNKTEKKDEGVDWNNSTAAAKTAIDELVYKQPIFANGGKINMTAKSTTFVVGEAIPLYRLASVCVDKSKKEYDQDVNVAVGENYAINNKIQLIGYNNNTTGTSVAYSKFLQGNGKWVACDENGKEISNSELFDITETNILKAKKAGSGFITYRLNDFAKKNYTALREKGKTVNPGDPHDSIDIVCDMPVITVTIK